MDAKRLKQLEKGNTRLKKLLAEKGAGPVDSPGGGGGKLLSPARARHRPLHWRQLPARWTDVEHTLAPQEVDPALIARFRAAMLGCFRAGRPNEPPASYERGEARSCNRFRISSLLF